MGAFIKVLVLAVLASSWPRAAAGAEEPKILPGQEWVKEAGRRAQAGTAKMDMEKKVAEYRARCAKAGGVFHTFAADELSALTKADREKALAFAKAGIQDKAESAPKLHLCRCWDETLFSATDAYCQVGGDAAKLSITGITTASLGETLAGLMAKEGLSNAPGIWGRTYCREGRAGYAGMGSYFLDLELTFSTKTDELTGPSHDLYCYLEKKDKGYSFTSCEDAGKKAKAPAELAAELSARFQSGTVPLR